MRVAQAVVHEHGGGELRSSHVGSGARCACTAAAPAAADAAGAAGTAAGQSKLPVPSIRIMFLQHIPCWMLVCSLQASGTPKAGLIRGLHTGDDHR